MSWLPDWDFEDAETGRCGRGCLVTFQVNGDGSAPLEQTPSDSALKTPQQNQPPRRRIHRQNANTTLHPIHSVKSPHTSAETYSTTGEQSPTAPPRSSVWYATWRFCIIVLLVPVAVYTTRVYSACWMHWRTSCMEGRVYPATLLQQQ